MSRELKQWIIEQAVQVPDVSVSNLKETIATIHDFMTEVNVAKEPIKKTYSPHGLTSTQKAFVRTVIDMMENGEKVNGTHVAAKFKVTQSSASGHLRTLIKKGYIRREGNKFWAIKDHMGADLPDTIVKYPPAPAKGYKPMTTKVGKTARLK